MGQYVVVIAVVVIGVSAPPGDCKHFDKFLGLEPQVTGGFLGDSNALRSWGKKFHFSNAKGSQEGPRVSPRYGGNQAEP